MVWALGFFLLCILGPPPKCVASEPVKIWVRFSDKGPGSLGQNKSTFPGMARENENLPVSNVYMEALKAKGFVCDTRLKWQNLVSGRIDPDSIPGLRAYAFITGISHFPRKAKPLPTLPRFPLNWLPPGLGKSSAMGIDYGAGRALMESLQVDKVHAWMRSAKMKPGKGMRVAVIDADFHLGSPIFSELFTQNRIRDQWDFVSNQAISVQQDLDSGSHGGECLSLIGGNLPGTLVGVAPEAEFLLYRAEENLHEGWVEEDYVAAAIERAVDSGAQVISISLGYRYEYDDGHADLPFSALDGKTRPSSIAAQGAARRNVLVSVAMGNLPSPDHIPTSPSISAPADADSILAVGIADKMRQRCSYSCTGPTADGRVKPDLVSMGAVGGCAVSVANTSMKVASLEQLQGTSFAAPVVAGIATILRQTHPELKAETIRQALISTSDSYETPDSLVGHGLLNAWAAFLKINGDTLPHASPVGWVRLYHGGGRIPLFIPRNSKDPLPKLELVELSGRRIPVTVQILGPTLSIEPEHDLRTGVYMVRIQ